ncbi:ABC transporter permease [Nocardioides yefusunii]|uniref:ABC transporter permease n=1 Tax=Nocardioides yefusunii TaxID=2500546 RepID=A0ABW1R0T9_9ACTN|nr:ABC transporter permease [Nocardioides yefusunii]
MTDPLGTVPSSAPADGGTVRYPLDPPPPSDPTRSTPAVPRRRLVDGFTDGAFAYRARRLAGTVVRLLLTVLGLLTLLFFLVRLSGDPAAVLAGTSASAEQLEAIRVQLGLDAPLLQQYVAFLGDVVRLDFGVSIFSQLDAMDLVLEKLPATVLLTVTTVVLALVCGIPAGVTLARGPRPVKVLLDIVITLFQAVPPFVLGVLLVWWFAVKAGVLPAFGSGSFDTVILPTLTLAAFTIARIARMLCAELEAGVDSDHLRTALAKGASRRRVLWRHALPNAFPPVAAMLVVEISYLLSGAVVVEVLFSYNGIGKLLVDSVFARDYPLVQACVFVIGMLVVVVNVVGELLMTRLDPRTTREGA